MSRWGDGFINIILQYIFRARVPNTEVNTYMNGSIARVNFV